MPESTPRAAAAPIRSLAVVDRAKAVSRIDEACAKRLQAGGAAVTDSIGRPVVIRAEACLAIVDDRHGIRHCSRRGSFALRAIEGDVVQPLCSTHLRRLIQHGGDVQVCAPTEASDE